MAKQSNLALIWSTAFVNTNELGAEMFTALKAIESDKIMSRSEFKLVQKHISVHDAAELFKPHLSNYLPYTMYNSLKNTPQASSQCSPRGVLL